MIKLNKATKSYGLTEALRSASLKIDSGETVGILGANGAGKSTLLKLIAGLIEPNEGTIEYSGELGADRNERLENIAYISEQGSYFPSMNARAHMELLCEFYPKFDCERFERLMEFFGLAMEKKASAMSKGERAKLECALGFSKGARLLLLDEPFLGKDIFTRRDFLKLSAALLDGETLLIATHEIGEIENFIERAVIISDGVIRADCTIDELHEHGKSLEDKLAEVSGYDPDRAKRML